MNIENERTSRVVDKIKETETAPVTPEEVREAINKMKNGKATGPDNIPVEVWKCLEEYGTELLVKWFNDNTESGSMPDDWRNSTIVPIYKNKEMYKTVEIIEV